MKNCTTLNPAQTWVNKTVNHHNRYLFTGINCMQCKKNCQWMLHHSAVFLWTITQQFVYHALLDAVRGLRTSRNKAVNLC